VLFASCVVPGERQNTVLCGLVDLYSNANPNSPSFTVMSALRAGFASTFLRKGSRRYEQVCATRTNRRPLRVPCSVRGSALAARAAAFARGNARAPSRGGRRLPPGRAPRSPRGTHPFIERGHPSRVMGRPFMHEGHAHHAIWIRPTRRGGHRYGHKGAPLSSTRTPFRPTRAPIHGKRMARRREGYGHPSDGCTQAGDARAHAA
jgi:hypothetical protein